MLKSTSSRMGLGLAAAGFAVTAISAPHAFAESRSYVVSSVTQAAYSQEGDCSKGIAPDQDLFARTQLLNMGKTEKEINDLMDGVNPDGTKDGNGYGGGHGTGKVHYMLIDRARVDGKPVNVYQNPAFYPDPKVPTVDGKFAYGFNLDGKGADSPTAFTDPDTKEKGVDNQYFRAMGCLNNHRGIAKGKQTYWNYVWESVRYAMPAWIITISGDDLSKDGAATVTIEKAVEHVEQDANSGTRKNFTFRIDPDQRFAKNVYPAEIKNGVVTTTQAGDFRMNADPYVITEWQMTKARLSLTMKPDGALEGLLGGYLPWRSIYYAYAHTGESGEMSFGIDIPGAFYNLRRLADGDPDPKTGEFTSISTAFHLEAVPAFTVRPAKSTKKVAAAKSAPATMASRD